MPHRSTTQAAASGNFREDLNILRKFLTGFTNFAHADTEAERTKRDELEEQLKKLEEEANAYDVIIQQIQGETRTLENEQKVMDAEIKQRELEIKRLSIAIQKAELDIQTKGTTIIDLSERIEKSRETLSASLLLLHYYNQTNALTVLLTYQNLSDFFTSLFSLQKLQESIQETLTAFKESRERLTQEKETAESFKKDQQELRSLQAIEKQFLAQKRKEREELLRLTKGKEAIFQQILSSKKKDIASLKTQLFYLEKTGISAENAVHFADLAAKRAGIRTEFLLALLEVETGRQFKDGVISVGTNLGSGNWNDDLFLCYKRLAKYFGSNKYNIRAEREKEAFFEITGRLGLDPDKMPVSKEPHYIGCGGAMGPAQFLPSTWLLFEKRVAELTGHIPPNPWNHEDAFTASALFLADSGATLKTADGEIRAAKTYISGNSRCSSYICNLYSRQIANLARDISRIL